MKTEKIKVLIKSIFKKLLPSKIIHTLRKIFGKISITDISLQYRNAKKMDKYITNFLNGKIVYFKVIPKKPELVGKKIFWQYWHTGINENTPKIVNNCLNSVKKFSNGYEIMLLSKNNLNDYIELPNFVFGKVDNGERFPISSYVDIVRLCLLSAYGGVWLDTTIYLTGPIEEGLLHKDFFAFQRSETPPPDADAYIKFNPDAFSWSSTNQAKMANYFIVAKPGYKIINDLLSILLEYWKKEKSIGYYFWFFVCFNRMIQKDEWKNLNCETINDNDCCKFQLVAFDKFDNKVWEEITSYRSIHKLTYFDRWGDIPPGSFAEYFYR